MNIKEKYNSKAKDSFETKLNLYIFDKFIKENTDEISSEDFGKFKISDDLVKVYTTKYWNWDEEKFNEIPLLSFKYEVKTDLTVMELYKEMKQWRENNKELIKTLEKDYVDNFEKIFPKEDFEALLSNKECYYCEITIDKVVELAEKEQIFNKQAYRGYTLEIDRKRPNEEYTPENTVMCCYWCNNAKTDEFCDKEFERIGKAIGEVWKERLSK